MHGLVAYDDDSQSDSEGPSRANGSMNPTPNDKLVKIGLKGSADARKLIIRRPPTHKNQTRAHISDDITSDDLSPKAGPSREMDGSPTEPSASTSQSGVSEEPQDEISRIRALLEPPSIPGVYDWGIPPECSQPCDPALQSKLAQFSELKQHSTNPKHFNDSLMSNRSFRNPHLYTKLVEFVDVDERVTNFPKELWDPNDVKREWFADQIADAQRRRSERETAAQSAGKRSRIDFARPKEKEVPAPPAKKSRFQPAIVPPTRDRPKTRWA